MKISRNDIVLTNTDGQQILDVNRRVIYHDKLCLVAVQNIINKKLNHKCQNKWEETFSKECNLDEIWKAKKSLITYQKLQEFHWQFIHHILFTENRLQVIGMSNGKCHFCHE